MTDKKIEDIDSKFYENAENYWKEVSPTVDGMLGGFESVSDADIRLSTSLITRLINDGHLTSDDDYFSKNVFLLNH